MAINITTPDHSFVRFGDSINESCTEPQHICLPVTQLNDINFQVIVTSDDVGDYTKLESSTGGLAYIVSVCRSCQSNADEQCNYWKKIEFVSTGLDIYAIGTIGGDTHSTATFDAMADGDCFSLCLYKVTWTGGGTMPNLCTPTPGLVITYVNCSNCFTKQEDDCFTSLISYRSNEDSMGFLYTGNSNLTSFRNKIRLPMFLSQPQFPKKEEVYVKSDGTRVRLSAQLGKEYKAETDYMMEHLHEKLAIALAHDSLLIENPDAGVNTTFICEGNTDIKWLDFLNYRAAKAEFKVRQTPYNLVNSNCS